MPEIGKSGSMSGDGKRALAIGPKLPLILDSTASEAPTVGWRFRLENIARGFGLRGHEIRDVSVIPKLFADFAAQGESEMWNIQISDQVTAPVIRQTIKRGHGNM